MSAFRKIVLLACIFNIAAAWAYDAKPTLKYKQHQRRRHEALQTAVQHKPEVKQPSAKPKPEPKFIAQTHIDGNIRAYYFTRQFGNALQPNQTAFSLGGKVNLLTGEFYKGFRLGGTLFTAQPLGLNSSNPDLVDQTLPGTPVTVLGQGFVQYENKWLFSRLGDQLITTPWANEADSRMIPAAYQGAYFKVTPLENLNLIFMRLIRFKARVSSNFDRTNLYNTGNATNAIQALGTHPNIGAVLLGAKFKWQGLEMQGWGYEFYDFANLLYGDFKYTLPTWPCFKPFVGAQGLREWANGSNIIASYGQGSVSSTAYGVLLGFELDNGQFNASFNNIVKNEFGYRRGDVVSPYTFNYSSDPFYTTSMMAGLVEKTAGSAFRINGNYLFFNKQLKVAGSYAKYFTSPYEPNTSELDIDITYFAQGLLKNLSIRDRLGILNGNPNNGRFVYNRVMLQYDF